MSFFLRLHWVTRSFSVAYFGACKRERERERNCLGEANWIDTKNQFLPEKAFLAEPPPPPITVCPSKSTGVGISISGNGSLPPCSTAHEAPSRIATTTIGFTFWEEFVKIIIIIIVISVNRISLAFALQLASRPASYCAAARFFPVALNLAAVASCEPVWPTWWPPIVSKWPLFNVVAANALHGGCNYPLELAAAFG